LLGKTKVTRQKLALCGAVGLWLMTAACSMLPPTKDETVENNTCWYSSCLANLPRSQCKTDWYWAQIAQCIDMYIYIYIIYIFIYLYHVFLGNWSCAKWILPRIPGCTLQKTLGLKQRLTFTKSQMSSLQNKPFDIQTLCKQFNTDPPTQALHLPNLWNCLRDFRFDHQELHQVDGRMAYVQAKKHHIETPTSSIATRSVNGGAPTSESTNSASALQCKKYMYCPTCCRLMSFCETKLPLIIQSWRKGHFCCGFIILNHWIKVHLFWAQGRTRNLQ
jgi:hypothetical protein